MLAEIVLVTVLGLILGSFSTALVYRIPKKIDWITQRSFCTSCTMSIPASRLVPLFSWFFSGGKCQCGQKISIRYPLIELLHAVLALCAYGVLGLGAELFFILVALPILISLFLIDLEHMILPNVLVFILAVIGLIRAVFLSASQTGEEINTFLFFLLSGILYAFTSWFLGWFLSKVLKKDSLGFGDVKFFFAAGLWLGISIFPYYLISSGFLGILSAILWRVIKKEEIFPFGPSLIASLYILVIFQSHSIL